MRLRLISDGDLIMHKLISSIFLVFLSTSSFSSGVRAEPASIQGYDGYIFGMTLSDALAMHSNAKQTKCDYVGVSTCIIYPTTISTYTGIVTVQFKGAEPKRVSRILITFSSPEEPTFSCKAITKTMVSLLVDKYGSNAVSTPGKAIWTFPHGGAVALVTLCKEDNLGIIIISYEPSNTL